MNISDKLYKYLELISIDKKVDLEEFSSLASRLSKKDLYDLINKLTDSNLKIRRDVLISNKTEIAGYLNTYNNKRRLTADILKYPSINIEQLEGFASLVNDENLSADIRKEILDKMLIRFEASYLRKKTGINNINFRQIKNINIYLKIQRETSKLYREIVKNKPLKKDINLR